MRANVRAAPASLLSLLLLLVSTGSVDADTTNSDQGVLWHQTGMDALVLLEDGAPLGTFELVDGTVHHSRFVPMDTQSDLDNQLVAFVVADGTSSGDWAVAGVSETLAAMDISYSVGDASLMQPIETDDAGNLILPLTGVSETAVSHFLRFSNAENEIAVFELKFTVIAWSSFIQLNECLDLPHTYEAPIVNTASAGPTDPVTRGDTGNSMWNINFVGVSENDSVECGGLAAVVPYGPDWGNFKLEMDIEYSGDETCHWHNHDGKDDGYYHDGGKYSLYARSALWEGEFVIPHPLVNGIILGSSLAFASFDDDLLYEAPFSDFHSDDHFPDSGDEGVCNGDLAGKQGQAHAAAMGHAAADAIESIVGDGDASVCLLGLCQTQWGGTMTYNSPGPGRFQFDFTGDKLVGQGNHMLGLGAIQPSYESGTAEYARGSDAGDFTADPTDLVI